MRCISNRIFFVTVFFLVHLGLTGCQSQLSLIEQAKTPQPKSQIYRIGPGDTLQLMVWRNPEFSLSLPVRPDGKISIPLINDVHASGKTASELALDVEKELSVYLKDPVVTVMVTQFVGGFADNIRIVGEAAQPQAIPFRYGMTILDVMILVGGITEFANGNQTKLVRYQGNNLMQYRVRLHDLLKEGDITANALIFPGDTLIIPEALF